MEREDEEDPFKEEEWHGRRKRMAGGGHGEGREVGRAGRMEGKRRKKGMKGTGSGWNTTELREGRDERTKFGELPKELGQLMGCKCGGGKGHGHRLHSLFSATL